jgi:hypothetical protein
VTELILRTKIHRKGRKEREERQRNQETAFKVPQDGEIAVRFSLVSHEFHSSDDQR